MGDFGIETAVRGSDGRYEATPLEDWRIWGPMGGYVASIALRAGAAEVEPGLPPASYSCQYFAPAEFRDVQLAVAVKRATRRTAAVAVSMTQDGAPILDAQIWFAAESDMLVHDHSSGHGIGARTDYPSIDERLASAPVEEPPFPFWLNFEAHPVDWIDDWANYVGGEPRWSEWLRFIPTATFDDPVLEACRLVVLADIVSWPAASRAHDSAVARQFVAPNLDLSVQFHRLADLGEWLLCSGESDIAERGLVGFRSGVWTEDGRLAASGSGQLLCRRVPPATPDTATAKD